MALEALELLKSNIKQDLLYKQLDYETLVWFSELQNPAQACSELNGNLGRYIRNKYKLWAEDLGGKHPDDFSFEIIQELWEYLA